MRLTHAGKFIIAIESGGALWSSFGDDSAHKIINVVPRSAGGACAVPVRGAPHWVISTGEVVRERFLPACRLSIIVHAEVVKSRAVVVVGGQAVDGVTVNAGLAHSISGVANSSGTSTGDFRSASAHVAG